MRDNKPEESSKKILTVFFFLFPLASTFLTCFYHILFSLVTEMLGTRTGNVTLIRRTTLAIPEIANFAMAVLL